MTSRVSMALLLMLVFAGCAEELGPEQFVTTRVHGTVLFGKKPVTRGWIEFWPTDGGVGVMRSAPIQPDGSFDATRVPVGRNAIGFTGTDLPRRLASEFQILRTRIRREIPEGPRSELKIDLLDEFARLTKDAGI